MYLPTTVGGCVLMGDGGNPYIREAMFGSEFGAFKI